MAGNKNSGRRPKSSNRMETEMLTYQSGPIAARYLAGVVEGNIQPEPLRVQVCRDTRDHVIGKPAQRVDVKQTEDITFRIITVPAAPLEPAIEGEVRLIE